MTSNHSNTVAPLSENSSTSSVQHVTDVDKTDFNDKEGAELTPSDKARCVSARDVIQLGVSLVLGWAFGVALEKSRVFEPKSIRLQMVFERWIMLKMFLTAVATGHLVLGVMSLIPICKSRLELAEEEYLCCLKKKGIITSCLGPFLLGVGMTLAGACPGMVLAQVGAWVPNSIFTLLGCLLGALLYGLVASTVERLTQPKTPFIHHQVHKKLNKPFALLALPACCLLAVTVLLMELFLPYQDNLEHPEKLSYNIAETIAWPPSVGGMIVGALQLPMVLVLKDTLGSSSSYVTVMSQWVVTSNLQRKFQYLAVRRTGVGNWWQVFYVSGGIVGGLSSSLASHSLASSQGVGVFEALCGGVVMLLGARLAAGCTSGHGISGVGLLMWLSLLAVPCMFGGAIVTAFIMRASNGSLDRFVNETLVI
ncbi:uncharacterized protein LOC112558218 [Pomacea canaliculata]|uniref:uncharacterized protein LOC112558218 n=1 Tax=Pomacea canaliculata TaxID=400727 RepID=UPI000D730361|nr:uncharacterized protein LOC112558218 [Pomacea canaliculata]